MASNSKRGVIVTLTGPSGVGKTSIARNVFEKDPAFEIISSITTRDARDSDILGEYNYVNKKDFLEMKIAGEFLWDLELHGNFYGTRRNDVDIALSLEKVSFMLLTPDVLKILRAYTDRVVSYFINVDDESVLRWRLQGRGESETNIQKRIEDCAEWEQDARQSEIPYAFIKNIISLDEVSEVLWKLILFEVDRIRNS